jgi:Ser/Thr protein kinase RdoA (MazF antagonist)
VTPRPTEVTGRRPEVEGCRERAGASTDRVGIEKPVISRMQRVGVDQLPLHLNATYGIEVTRVEELDLGVYRVDRAGGGSWVARLFPGERPAAQAAGDAEILQCLAEVDYPAERCATAEPVSSLQGQALLVTEFVPSVARGERRDAIRSAGGLAALGWLLGRLQTLPGTREVTARPGGSWHHLADGAPENEVAAIGALLRERPVDSSLADLYGRLEEEAAGLDRGEGLPESIVHPDFVLANVVVPRTGGLVIVDWTGAGRAPRVWSLAFLLWSVGFGGDLSRVDRTVAGYRRHITPEPEELERLEALIRVRPTVLDTWAVCMGRKPLTQALESIAASREAASAIAERARAVFATH